MPEGGNERTIEVECRDCDFGFRTDDPVEAFDRQYAHDTEQGHHTIKRHLHTGGDDE